MYTIKNRTLALLSLFTILGILIIPEFWGSKFIFIPILLCFIGGFSFGALIRKSIK